jgi:hypothetical protein
MITNDEEMKATLQRIQWFQQQILQLRTTEDNPKNYHASASGFLEEIDRMQLEVREYFSLHPSEQNAVP